MFTTISTYYIFPKTIEQIRQNMTGHVTSRYQGLNSSEVGAKIENLDTRLLRVVQFSTEIKLVITNRTPASRSCDFVNTRLISVQFCTPLSSITIINWSLYYMYNNMHKNITRLWSVDFCAANLKQQYNVL
jgi:hypothetical protein